MAGMPRKGAGSLSKSPPAVSLTVISQTCTAQPGPQENGKLTHTRHWTAHNDDEDLREAVKASKSMQGHNLQQGTHR